MKAFMEFNDKIHSMANIEGSDNIEIVDVLGGGE